MILEVELGERSELLSKEHVCRPKSGSSRSGLVRKVEVNSCHGMEMGLLVIKYLSDGECVTNFRVFVMF